MSPDQFQVAELNAALDQARAAWWAARAAWLQAVLTPMGIIFAVLTAFGVPELQRREEERRINILAVNTAGQVVGVIGMLLQIGQDPDIIGNVHSEIPIQAVNKAMEALQAFPRGRLSKPHIDTALRLLEVQMLAAQETAPRILQTLKQRPLTAEAVLELRRRRDRALQLYLDVCKAAKMKGRDLEKLQSAVAA